MKSKDLLMKVFKNKVLTYVLNGYATYLVQFINSIFVAVYLGPYYLGIWGFFNLVVQYFSQMNLGIGHSVNAIGSVHKSEDEYIRKIFGTGMAMFIALSIFMTLIILSNNAFDLGVGDKYSLYKYTPFVIILVVFSYLNGLMSTCFRIYGKLYEIAIAQALAPVLTLIVILNFKGNNLLWALVMTNSIASMIIFLIYLIRAPIKIKPLFNVPLIQEIQTKGWYLFIYNTSFYLIIITSRSFISGYYSVTEFGFFTFAFTLANAILLLLETFSYLIYPKMLNRFAISSNEKVAFLLELVRDAYITTSHLLIHISILLFPFFSMYFPKYENINSTFNLIALTVVLFANSFGYSGLIISKGKEKKLALISFLALTINIVLALFLVIVLKVEFSYVIFATMLSYLFYVLTIGFLGRSIMQLKTDFISLIKDVLPVRMFLPYILSVIFVLLSFKQVFFIIPLFFFIALNYKALIRIKNTAKSIFVNPDFINI